MKYFVQVRTTSRQKFIVEAEDMTEARRLVRAGAVKSMSEPEVSRQVIECDWPLADQTLEAGNNETRGT